jgi:hypothetical protein
MLFEDLPGPLQVPAYNHQSNTVFAPSESEAKKAVQQRKSEEKPHQSQNKNSKSTSRPPIELCELRLTRFLPKENVSTDKSYSDTI